MGINELWKKGQGEGGCKSTDLNHGIANVWNLDVQDVYFFSITNKM